MAATTPEAKARKQERAKARQAARRSAWKMELLDIKENSSCFDCRQHYPHYMLEFDHVPERGPKVAAVSQMSNYSEEDRYAELAKCDVVCANCHAARTYFRRLS